MLLTQFEFTETLIERFKNQNTIPVNFYNKYGQILIHKKDHASIHEVNQLLKFQETGIYYNKNDFDQLTGTKKPAQIKPLSNVIPKGLSSTKLFSQVTAQQLTSFTQELFNKLKHETIDSVTAHKTEQHLNSIFSDFSEQPDAMIGLLNILEVVNNTDSDYEVALAVKRTVVAMALKTRGVLAQTDEERERLRKEICTLMTSSLLCDIAFLKMNLPQDRRLTAQEYEQMKRHPLISYLMIAPEAAIDNTVKHLILFQHYREKGKPNNYPSAELIDSELNKRINKYGDIKKQLHALQTDMVYSHNANILGIASKFSFLTTATPWKKAYSPTDAVRAIINNAIFTYSYQSIREFLDYSAISLCNNNEIIHSGDIIVIEAASYTGESAYEICMVIESSRFQSRPFIKRFATLSPIISNSPKTAFANFNLTSIKPDKRHIDIDLNRDNSRFIVYIIDPRYDKELFRAATELISTS